MGLEQIIYQPDIAATVLQYLDDTDILEFKLCSNFVKNLTETVVPRHVIFKVLQLIENYHFPLPSLQLPTHFLLDQKIVNKIHQYCCNVDRIITTFIIHHTNQFCFEFMKHFSLDWKFVASWSQQQDYKDSPVMNTISQWSLLVDCKDMSSHLWNATMWREKALFFPMKSLTPLTTLCHKQCIQNRSKLLFCILQGTFTTANLEKFSELVNDPLWSEEYQHDPVIWNAFVSSLTSETHPTIFKSVCLRFKCSEEEEQESDVIHIIRQSPIVLFERLSSQWFSNKNVMLEGIRKRFASLNRASIVLQKDTEFIKETVKLNPGCYLIAKHWYALNPSFVGELRVIVSRFFPCPQKNEIETLLERIAINGNQIAFSSHTNTKSVALSAVRSTPTSLMHLSERLKNDEEIVLKAVQRDPTALQYAAERFRNEKLMVVKVLQRNGKCLLHISKKLQSDREVVLFALQYCPALGREEIFKQYVSLKELEQVIFKSYGINHFVPCGNQFL